jgi:hypothetical protein
VIGLGWRGIAAAHPVRYLVGAGLINGVVLSILFVKLFGAKFQALILGAMTGVSLDNLQSKESLAKKSIQLLSDWIHQAVTATASSVEVGLLERGLFWSVIVTAAVTFASLISNWIFTEVSASRAGGAP